MNCLTVFLPRGKLPGLHKTNFHGLVSYQSITDQFFMAWLKTKASAIIFSSFGKLPSLARLFFCLSGNYHDTSPKITWLFSITPKSVYKNAVFWQLPPVFRLSITSIYLQTTFITAITLTSTDH